MQNSKPEVFDSLCLDEIQKYLYYVATTVQKDFGTGSYMKNFHKKQLTQHYDCKVKEYLRFKGFLTSNRKIKNILQKEINANRPVYFHYTNLNGGEHSVVADDTKLRIITTIEPEND